MNNLFSAMTTKDIFTENGMPTNSSSGSFLVDLFYRMGSTRTGLGWDRNTEKMDTELIRLFNGSFSENPFLTIKALFYNRDVRGGQQERRSFRIMFQRLCYLSPETAKRNLENVPFYGRWDDLLVCLGTPVEESALDLILYSLKKGDRLCAKWMPRENKSLGIIARYLAKKWNLSPKNYRLLLSGNTQVVENLMCKNEWGEIIYKSVPTKALFKYRRAFGKHDEERWLQYIADLKSGKITRNAEVMFPHEIVEQVFLNSDLELMLELWKGLPNYLETEDQFLPICDVSGSMDGLPMMVCISLGIYLSERNKSIFKDGFITFSKNPELQILNGDLISRIQQLRIAEWGMNTDLEKVFLLILENARKANLKESDMPKYLIILSDMQFDQATRSNQTALKMIKDKYRTYGYEIPKIVFWNLRNSEGVPVKKDKSGAVLISGFSPSIMKYLFKNPEKFSPASLVEEVLLSERYERVR